MNHAAVLSVLVKAEGIAQTAAKVEALERDMDKAAAAGGDMAKSADQADRAVRKMGGGSDQAKSKVSGLANEMDKARKASDLWQDSAGRWRNSVGQFASDAEKAAAGIALIDRNGRKGSGGINMVRNAVSALGGGLGPLAATLVMIAPLLLALSGAAFALGAALAPLVGLAGAAAVGLTALAQAAGVLALASMGVGDALKEQMDAGGKAAKAATSSADQQRSAARAIEGAQEGVRAAHDRVRAATENLAQAEHAQKQALDALAPARQQARRDLEDMRSALVGAVLDEKTATQGLEEAKKALAESLKPADTIRLADAQATLTASTFSQQRAVLSLTDAQVRLQDVMKPADALTLADAQDSIADAARGETRATLALAKAREDASKVFADPLSTDAAKAAAKLDVADAENAIGDASRASAHAQEQLAKLQAPATAQDLAKAKLDVAEAEFAIGDAARGTAKAQQDVQDAMKGSDPAAVAKATLDVAHAQHTLADATRDRARLEKDLATAEKNGISGAPGVIAAKQSIADADRGVIAAQRELVDAGRGVTKATQAVKDAQLDAATASGAAAAAGVDLNAKFNALPPAAQAFVLALKGLKPKLDELRATAASGLFPGVISGMDAAMGSFGSVKTVVGETAGVLGDLADRAGELVGSSAFGKDIETVGHRNAIIISRIGRAAIILGGAFMDLLVAAGPLTTWLALSALEWAKSTAEAVKAGRESGKLGDFFQKVRNTLVRVVSILGNLASAFYEAGKQAAPFGRDMLASIDKVTGKFAEWTKSVEGQRALQDFFAQSTELAGKLMPALGGVLESLGSLAFSVLPAYVKILEFLGPLAGPLVQAFVLWKLALTGVTIATTLFSGALWLYTAATAPATAGQIALNTALLANPIALVVVGLIALGAALVIAYKKSETFRDIVNGVWAAIKTVAEPVIDWLATAIPAAWEWIKTATVNVWEFLKPYLEGIWNAIKTIVTTYFDAYKAVIGGAWTVIKAVTTKLWDWFGPYLEGVFVIAKAAIEAFFIVAKALVTGAWTVVKTATTKLWDWFGPYLDGIWEGVKTAASAAWGLIKSAITGPISDAVGVVKDAIGHGGKDPAGLIGWLSGAWDDVKGVFDKAKDTLATAIAAPFKAGLNLISGFAKKILEVVDLIPGVDMKKPIGEVDDFRKSQGFARGGAFARTGGIVNSPITLMGEEAPRHPEIVVPTNPAYRGRAQKLAMMAANAVGLAQGGTFQAFAEGGINQYNHTYPWHNVGTPGASIPPEDVKRIAESVNLPGRLFEQLAHGESNHQPGVISNDGGYGMWQMTPRVWGAAGLAMMKKLGGLAAMANPFQNGKMAKYLLDDAGGDYKKIWFGTGFVGKDSDGGGGIFDGIKNALGGAWDLLKDGAGALLGKLPSTDGLGMLKGLGANVLSDVASWIKDKAAGIIGGGESGGGGGGSATGLVPRVLKAIEFARSHGWHGSINSGFRSYAEQAALYQKYLNGTGNLAAPPGTSNHEKGIAIDVSDTESFARAMALMGDGALMRKVPGEPWHFSTTGFAQGGAYGASGLLGSYETGTPYVPQTGPYLLHKGEGVVDAKTNAAGRNGPLVHIEHAEFKSEADLTVFARDLGFQLS